MNRDAGALLAANGVEVQFIRPDRERGGEIECIRAQKNVCAYGDPVDRSAKFCIIILREEQGNRLIDAACNELVEGGKAFPFERLAHRLVQLDERIGLFIGLFVGLFACGRLGGIFHGREGEVSDYALALLRAFTDLARHGAVARGERENSAFGEKVDFFADDARQKFVDGKRNLQGVFFPAGNADKAQIARKQSLQNLDYGRKLRRLFVRRAIGCGNVARRGRQLDILDQGE